LAAPAELEPRLDLKAGEDLDALRKLYNEPQAVLASYEKSRINAISVADEQLGQPAPGLPGG
jgi:hypothetical protein